MVSALAQDAEYSGDFEVSYFPVFVDTCAPTPNHLDNDLFYSHSRVTDQLSGEQTDGTLLTTSGVGTLAVAPGNVMQATRASLTTFYNYIRQNKTQVKIIAYEDSGYSKARSKN